MTTKEIQSAICKQEVLKGNHPCENVSFFFVGESDVLSLNKTGYTHEFEVKVSRSDFKADQKKRKWLYFENRVEKQIPNYFSYACPAGMIGLSEIPSYAGLVYLNDGSIEIIRKPSILHRSKPETTRILTKFARVMAERLYLGGCMLTYRNRQIKARRVA